MENEAQRGPTEAQVKAAMSAHSTMRFDRLLQRIDAGLSGNPKQLRIDDHAAMEAALVAASLPALADVDEKALAAVVFNAVEKWADMYPTPQVSEMIASAVAQWLRGDTQ